ncbi:unnamed protein product [Notodromas monacha]|uniref:PH domain-containing protein n=1 Tax=Notodromas monacha TaxID=399045 RepID=A0A7R9GIK2_9CRUS|nr:unnamed protein product [Notodromas monacha]CAG0922548.1 unnamed protein product [Notodromas monacha]
MGATSRYPADDTFCDVIKSGHVKIKSRKLGMWQRRWIVLRRATSEGSTRIDKYPDRFQHKDAATSTPDKRLNILPKSTLELKDVSRVSRLPLEFCPAGFCVEFKDGNSRTIACDTEKEADEWIDHIIRLCLTPTQTGMRNNRLFASIPAQFDEVFNVYLIPSHKTVISGEVLLQVAPDRIYLWDIDAPQLKLLEWPILSIQRFGRDSKHFSIDVGGRFPSPTPRATGSSSSPPPSDAFKPTVRALIPGEVYDEAELLMLLDDDSGIDITTPCNIIVSLKPVGLWIASGWSNGAQWSSVFSRYQAVTGSEVSECGTC